MTSLSAALEARDKLEELKPCPLCGSTPRLTREKQYRIMIQDWHDKDEELYQLYKIQCPNCGCAIKKSANNAENGGESRAAIAAKEKPSRRGTLAPHPPPPTGSPRRCRGCEKCVYM